MLDSKFFITLVGLVFALFAICNTNTSKSVSENFWMNPSTGVRTFKELKINGQPPIAIPNNYKNMFVQYPNFQGKLSPRAAPVDYGANIRYNMPSYKNLAVPHDPLAFGDMAKENYQHSNSNSNEKVGCGKGSVINGGKNSTMNNMSSYSDYSSAMDAVYSSDNTTHINGDSLVAVGDMTTINSLGLLDQPVIYDRIVFSTNKGRNSGQGCPIRGDNAIAPCGGNWFSVHPVPSRDLRQGAMNVLAGNGETTQAMNKLLYESSGNTLTTIGGVDMTHEYMTSIGAVGGEVNVTRFP